MGAAEGVEEPGAVGEGAVRGAAAGPQQAVRAATTAYLYTLGFVTEEQGVQPLAGERREGYDVDDRARRMADFPLSAAAGAEIFEDCDRHFEEGLALVNAGIGTRYGVG